MWLFITWLDNKLWFLLVWVQASSFSKTYCRNQTAALQSSVKLQNCGFYFIFLITWDDCWSRMRVWGLVYLMCLMWDSSRSSWACRLACSWIEYPDWLMWCMSASVMVSSMFCTAAPSWRGSIVPVQKEKAPGKRNPPVYHIFSNFSNKTFWFNPKRKHKQHSGFFFFIRSY